MSCKANHYLLSWWFFAIWCSAGKNLSQCQNLGYVFSTRLYYCGPRLLSVVSGVMSLLCGPVSSIICKVPFSGLCQICHTKTTSMQQVAFRHKLLICPGWSESFSHSQLPRFVSRSFFSMSVFLPAYVLCGRTQGIIQMMKNIAIKTVLRQWNKRLVIVWNDKLFSIITWYKLIMLLSLCYHYICFRT